MGGKKKIPTMLFPESQPITEDGISSINSGTLEKELELQRIIMPLLPAAQQHCVVWPLQRAVCGFRAFCPLEFGR